MVLFTALIATVIPHQLDEIPQPIEPNWCNISYVTREHCPQCVEQINIINQTNISCEIRIINENTTAYKYLTVDKPAPFWFDNGKKTNEIYTKDEIIELIHKR